MLLTVRIWSSQPMLMIDRAPWSESSRDARGMQVDIGETANLAEGYSEKASLLRALTQ